MPLDQTQHESNLTNLRAPLYEARQACHFMKHAKHVSTPSSQSTRAHQAREHVKHASTQARHLADALFTRHMIN